MDGGTNGLGMRVAKFELVTSVGEIETFEKSSLRQNGTDSYGMVEDFCLLLPFRSRHGEDFNSTYVMITHEWNALNRNGEADIAGLCPVLYNLNN